MLDLSELPKRGPFHVDEGYLGKKRLTSGLLALLMAVLSGLMLWLMFHIGGEILHERDIWARGTQASGEIGFDGEVRTTNFIFKEYKLKVQYRHPESGLVTFEVAFYRWFTGPDQNDPMEVRFVGPRPEDAVSSWEVDAHTHGWIFALLAAALAGLMGWAVVAAFRTYRAERDKLTRLAESGQIVLADVVSYGPTGDPKTKLYLLEFRVGGVLHKRTLQQKQVPWLSDDRSQAVVLASAEGHEAELLLDGGQPLSL